MTRGLQRPKDVGVLPYRGTQRPRHRVIGQGQVSFQPRRSDLLPVSRLATRGGAGTPAAPAPVLRPADGWAATPTDSSAPRGSCHHALIPPSSATRLRWASISARSNSPRRCWVCSRR